MISDPPADICLTCGDIVGVSQILSPQSPKHLSAEGLLDVVFIFYSHWG